jgi:hypothetical protein
MTFYHHTCRGCGKDIPPNVAIGAGRCKPCHDAWMAREREIEKCRRETQIKIVEEGVRRALAERKP